MATKQQKQVTGAGRRAGAAPWAEVLTLGETRFGILAGGPFDGRCYPLPVGETPPALDVPAPRPGPSLRYVLREGLYRFQRMERPAA